MDTMPQLNPTLHSNPGFRTHHDFDFESVETNGDRLVHQLRYLDLLPKSSGELETHFEPGFWVGFDSFGRFLPAKTNVTESQYLKVMMNLMGNKNEKWWLRWSFGGELAVLSWGNTHPSNVLEKHTNSRQQKRNLKSRVILPHEKPGKSKLDHFRRKNANWISVRTLIFFMPEVVDFFGRGLGFQPPKIIQTTRSLFLFVFFCFI